VRSERMLMEQLQYNMLFLWFVGLNMDDEVWNATTFSKNRDRLLRGEIAEEFFAAVARTSAHQELLSDEHFTVDGTMVEGWASLKSFQPKDESQRSNDDKPDDPGNPTVNFHGQNWPPIPFCKIAIASCANLGTVAWARFMKRWISV
jgi:hypothetical protein